MKILTVTSGKGGVGKTTISVNMAKQLSLQGIRTILVDLDIHNKGATSLFLDKVEEVERKSHALSLMGMLSFLNEPGEKSGAAEPLICTLDGKDKLFFWPATKTQELIEWSALRASNEVLIERLNTSLSALSSQKGIEVAILDCYGGIDALTIAAAGAADSTIIVNEPDLITFSGTLLLYSYLSEIYKDSARRPSVHFIINRITSRHSFAFLQQEYQKNLAPLSADGSILAYLPFDRLVMETFGDYPFYTELLPQSLVCRKLKLALSLLWPELSFKEIASMSRRARQRLFQATSESQFAEPEAILRTLISIPFWIIVPGIVKIAVPALSAGRNMSYAVIWQLIYLPFGAFGVLLLALGVFEPIQITRWLWRVAYYRRRKRALRKKLGRLRRLTISIFGMMYALAPAIAGVGFASALPQLSSDALPSGWRDISQWNGGVYGIAPGSDLSGLQMSSGSSFVQGLDLSSVKFKNAGLEGVSFQRVKLEGADFTGVSALSAKFDSADLKGADFSFANLTEASFAGANLQNANFTQATLPSLSSFRDAYWAGANLAGSTADIGVYLVARSNGAQIDASQQKAVDALLVLHPDIPHMSFDQLLALTQSPGSNTPGLAQPASPINSEAILRNFEAQRANKLYKEIPQTSKSQ
jgi:cellulose biosynthesis protein BcsQ